MTQEMILPSDFPSDADLYQHMENEELRRKAYILLVGQEKSIKDVAAEIAVPVNTVRQWVVRGHWNARLREMRDQREEEEAIALSIFRGENRIEEVKGQLAAGKRGREMVQEMLDDPTNRFDAGELKRLGEALAAFSGVAARAVGVGETVETRDKKGEEEKSGRMRPPAVVIITDRKEGVTVREASPT